MADTPERFRWLDWAREIQSLAQTGSLYAVNEWQSERYHRLTEIAAEIVYEHTKFPIEVIQQDFINQTGYATPKVDVRGAVFSEGKLLMVREKVDNGWTMPGGWADVGDSPAAGAEREVWEESGYQVKAKRLVGVYDSNRIDPMTFYHAYKLVFLCEIIGGEAKTSNETTEVAFFGEDEIPREFAGERTQLKHVRDAFAILADPMVTTVFE